MPRESFDDQTLDEALAEWADAVLLAGGCDGDSEGGLTLAREIEQGCQCPNVKVTHVD